LRRIYTDLRRAQGRLLGTGGYWGGGERRQQGVSWEGRRGGGWRGGDRGVGGFGWVFFQGGKERIIC